MNGSIGRATVTVTAVDDRTLLSPDVLEAVVNEVIRRLDRRDSSTAAQRDEAAIWPSVRTRGSA